MSSDKCSGCPDSDKCSLDGLFEKMINPGSLVKPGEKISMAKAGLMEKGGYRAFLNPGVSYKDFSEGRFAKSLLIVEDDSDLRMDLVKMLRPTVFRVYAAPTYEDALGLIEKRETLPYVLLDDRIPEARGKELGNFADRLYDKVMEKFPEARVFAYAEDSANLERPYLGTVEKGEDSLNEVYRMLITDSETVVESIDQDKYNDDENKGE